VEITLSGWAKGQGGLGETTANESGCGYWVSIERISKAGGVNVPVQNFNQRVIDKTVNRARNLMQTSGAVKTIV
jgi:hypothetical protein